MGKERGRGRKDATGTASDSKGVQSKAAVLCRFQFRFWLTGTFNRTRNETVILHREQLQAVWSNLSNTGPAASDVKPKPDEQAKPGQSFSCEQRHDRAAALRLLGGKHRFGRQILSFRTVFASPCRSIASTSSGAESTSFSAGR